MHTKFKMVLLSDSYILIYLKRNEEKISYVITIDRNEKIHVYIMKTLKIFIHNILFSYDHSDIDE